MAPNDSSNDQDLSIFSDFIETLPQELFPKDRHQEGGLLYIELPTDEERARAAPGILIIKVTNTLTKITYDVRVFTDCLNGQICKKVFDCLIFNVRESHAHIAECKHCIDYKHKTSYDRSNTKAG